MGDLLDKLFAEEAGGAKAMGLEPCDEFAGDGLTGGHGCGEFGGIVGVVVYEPNAFFASYDLVSAVDARVGAEGIGAVA